MTPCHPRTLAVLAAGLLVAGCGGDRTTPLIASGTLEATEVAVSTPLGGRVTSVRAQEGHQVAAGDTLVILDVAKLVTQGEQAAAAREGVLASRDAAGSALAQADARLEQVTRAERRLAALLPQAAATQQQVDDARSELRAASAAREAARHSRAALDARARELGAAERLLAQQRADGIVVAPSAATVLARAVEPGETARPSQTLVTLAELTRLWVRVYVPEREMARVRLGSTVHVRVDAFPDRRFEGAVAWIASKAEFTPKNVQTSDARAELVFAVKVTLDNADRALAIGMPADVEFPAVAADAPPAHATR